MERLLRVRRGPSHALVTVVVATLAVTLALACGGGDDETPATTPPSAATPRTTVPADAAASGGATRSFRMGFTPFPFAGDIDSFIAISQAIAEREDLAVHHFDGGVPWPQALVDDTYPANFDSELTGRATTSPRGAARYVAVTPLSPDRSGLALMRGASENQPLPAPWDVAALDDADVVSAFTNFARHVILRLEPDYFAYAIEANMLIDAAPERWPAFVSFASQVYPVLKAEYPDLPIFVTIQAEWFHSDVDEQTERLAGLMPYTDMIAVSSYGYVRNINPPAIDDYLDRLTALAPEKPFAISETGWPAEPLAPPFAESPAFSPSGQSQYLSWLLTQADARDARFVVWFFPRDFDRQWDAGLSESPAAPTVRLFRDLGLWDGEGTPRPAMGVWREWLRREVE